MIYLKKKKYYKEDTFMYCSNCGQEISNGSTICPTCGVIIGNQNQGTQQQMSFDVKTTPQKLGLLTGLCIAAIILCWPAAVFGFIRRGQALKAGSVQEANRIVNQSIKVVVIWVIVALVVGFVLGFIGAL